MARALDLHSRGQGFDSLILHKKESGVRNLESGIWNLESGIWNLESGVRNLES